MNDKIKVILGSEFPRRKGSRQTGELAADIYAAIGALKSGERLRIECGCGESRHCVLRSTVLTWAKRRGINIETVHDEDGQLNIRLRPDKQAHK